MRSVSSRPSRRAFLRSVVVLTGVTAVTPLIASCGQQAPPTPQTKIVERVVTQVVEKPVTKEVIVTATAAPKAAAQQATIRWRTYSGNGEPGKTLAGRVVSRFQEIEPGIKVQHEAFGVPDWMRLFITDVAAGTPPDVVQNATEYFDQQAVTGVLRRLDPYIQADKYDLEGLHPAAIAMCKSIKDGGIYALPEGLVPNLVWYNVDLFQAAGVKEPPTDGSWTFDDMLAMAKALTKRDGRGVATQFGLHLYRAPMPFAWYDINSAFGGESVDKNWTRTMIHEGGAREGTKWIFDLYNVHKVSPTPEDEKGIGTNPFFVGKSAMFYNYMYMLDPMLSYPKLQFRGVPSPKGPAGNKSNLRPWYHTVAQAAKSPDAAARFLLWFTGSEGLAIWAPVTITSRPAVNKSSWELLPPKWADRPRLAQIGEKFGYAAVYGPGHGDWFKAMSAELEKAYTGQISFDEAIVLAAKAGDVVIKENNERAGLKK